jgi:hypothetical protein
MATGQFTDYKFYRLLHQDESDGFTYVIQYITADEKHYKKYVNEFSSALTQKAAIKWGKRVVTFSTVMEAVY